MPPDPIIDDDSDYASSEDSDFAPETAPLAASDDSSNSESEAEFGGDKTAKQLNLKPTKRKRETGGKNGEAEAEDVGFGNSGDEEILERGLKRLKRKGKKGKEDEDEGGEGGFVKTRRMAALAIEEKKPLASTASATVDVDALWASMTSEPAKKTADPKAVDANAMTEDDATKSPHTAASGHPKNDMDKQSSPMGRRTNDELDGEGMIMIQRTYNFAGKVHAEEKLVSRDSAEARLWLQSQSSEKSRSPPSDRNITKPLKPPKKARRSIFEPITEPLPQRTDLRFSVSNISRNRADIGLNTGVAAKKLNTVEKSKMDWAGFVDKEGIKDELETAGKAKGAYLDQKEFLARVEDKREEEVRRIRLKG